MEKGQSARKQRGKRVKWKGRNHSSPEDLGRSITESRIMTRGLKQRGLSGSQKERVLVSNHCGQWALLDVYYAGMRSLELDALLDRKWKDHGVPPMRGPIIDWDARYEQKREQQIADRARDQMVSSAIKKATNLWADVCKMAPMSADEQNLIKISLTTQAITDAIERWKEKYEPEPEKPAQGSFLIMPITDFSRLLANPDRVTQQKGD